MIRRALLVLVVLAGAARAESAKLVAARHAITDVRYDDARELLVDALEAGDNRPGEVIEIYQLSAATAVVLGQSDLAEQYYRRVLALEPEAKLPFGASPKLRQPFVAAQAYMAALGRLDARAQRRGSTVELAIVSDPLRMVAAVAVIIDGAVRTKRALNGEPIVLEPAATGAQIAMLDEYGNVLRQIAVPDGAVRDDRAPHRMPLWRRWTTWVIPAAVLAGSGAGFLIDARRAKGRLDDILASNASYFLDDAEQQRRRWRDHTLVADVAFGAAAVCAVAAVITAATKRSQLPPAAVAPIVRNHQLGLALQGNF